MGQMGQNHGLSGAISAFNSRSFAAMIMEVGAISVVSVHPKCLRGWVI